MHVSVFSQIKDRRKSLDPIFHFGRHTNVNALTALIQGLQTDSFMKYPKTSLVLSEKQKSYGASVSLGTPHG